MPKSLWKHRKSNYPQQNISDNSNVPIEDSDNIITKNENDNIENKDIETVTDIANENDISTEVYDVMDNIQDTIESRSSLLNDDNNLGNNDSNTENITTTKEEENTTDIISDNNYNSSIEEIDLTLEDLPDNNITLKDPNEVYYKMYRDARQKAKMARELALASYLEAKNIKNT